MKKALYILTLTAAFNLTGLAAASEESLQQADTSNAAEFTSVGRELVETTSTR
ncbi:MAG TPA: hypothetical protein VNW71_24460 [Thermoanaerobaculia bacterium]|nr:hypothetical protein [Thermoanaerobaculia bacterium]